VPWKKGARKGFLLEAQADEMHVREAGFPASSLKFAQQTVNIFDLAGGASAIARATS
jgi:hypothetical protein